MATNCSKCGAPLPEGAQVCPACGEAANVPPPPPQAPEVPNANQGPAVPPPPQPQPQPEPQPQPQPQQGAYQQAGPQQQPYGGPMPNGKRPFNDAFCDVNGNAKPEDFQAIINNAKYCLQHFADFNGRARRKEFWYFSLAWFAIGIAFNILSIIPYLGILFSIVYMLLGLAVIVPSLAVGARRLSDTGRNPLLLLLMLIPIVGVIILIVWWCEDSKREPNEQGPSPKYQPQAFA